MIDPLRAWSASAPAGRFLKHLRVELDGRAPGLGPGRCGFESRCPDCDGCVYLMVADAEAVEASGCEPGLNGFESRSSPFVMLSCERYIFIKERAMQKIISLFARNYDTDHLVRNEVVPGAEWVIAGEGVATRKWDGTCCRVREGVLYRRHEVKPGKTPPAGFEPATDADPNTGKQQGWVAVGDDAQDRWFREAFVGDEADWTYELCGPKVQGNPEQLEGHRLIPHGKEELADAPRSFEALRDYLKEAGMEGIVWHHPDGRRVKIKARDFGIKF